MKLWVKGVLAGLAVLAGGGGMAVAVWGQPAAERLEADFQTAADAKRVNDVHKIGELLEAYRAKTGRLPFEEKMPAGSILTVLVAAPKAQAELEGRGNPLGVDPPGAFAGHLLAELRPVVGDEAVLPVDPQRGATGAPNAYYVRFKPGGQYLVAAFLRQPRANATRIAPGVYVYALRSHTGAWGGEIWAGARTPAGVPTAEREHIRAQGDFADAQFGKYMQTWTDGGLVWRPEGSVGDGPRS